MNVDKLYWESVIVAVTSVYASRAHTRVCVKTLHLHPGWPAVSEAPLSSRRHIADIGSARVVVRETHALSWSLCRRRAELVP